MKQLIQNLKTGVTSIIDVPKPKIGRDAILIKTHRSLVSLGTEKMLVEFGQANLLSKARQQPERVKEVLAKIKSDGLTPTLEAVFNKLDEPLPLGYCNAGEVIEVGSGVTEFKVGDRVVSNGPHAEIVSVSKNLVSRIPDGISYEEASFTVIGSIGLQGIRLVNPTYGETVVVIGLGLIGLITAQLLLANGCNVIGFDFDASKIEIANKLGVRAFKVDENFDQVEVVLAETNRIGADAVLITASTKSNDVITNAAKMSRKRGRIVLVGVVGLNINRADFYEKELSFQVSCSYGPGRYDENYENKGIDYPIGFVRWTEKRNFEAILNGISKRTLDVKSLITEVVDFEDFDKIYSDMGKGNSIASILKYSDNPDLNNTVKVVSKSFEKTNGSIAIIGAGNFTKMTMMPILSKINSAIKYVVSAGGLSATNLAKKHQIANSTTDYKTVLDDNEVDAVIITTRHNLHAKMTIDALKSGKHVFVEKPLALSQAELDDLISTYNDCHSGLDPESCSSVSLTVGYNRRFSPFIQTAKTLLGEETQVNIIATMNAGFIPKNVWVHDLEVGGGRIVGEACHFIDLAIFLTGSLVKSVSMSALGTNPEESTDNAVLTLKFQNGSQAVVNYFSNGSKSYSKERIELYSQNKTLVLDNFREMVGYGFKGFKKMKSKQDKGHKEQFTRYNNFLKTGGESLIPFNEIINSSKASFAAIESLKQGRTVYLD
ncbi:MAG: bi-domain-containing oxidoreductase [Ignavibacteriales bacterium]|nr:bi-domain-containing oxidoreductase [Ignavibacteriales bacterium]